MQLPCYFLDAGVCIACCVLCSISPVVLLFFGCQTNENTDATSVIQLSTLSGGTDSGTFSDTTMVCVTAKKYSSRSITLNSRFNQVQLWSNYTCSL